MERNSIPYNQKLCITIEEAAEYSMLGENRIRRIIEQDKQQRELDWTLYIGQRVRVKRELFEKWVLEQSYLS